MAYSEFTLAKAQNSFNLALNEVKDLFADIQEVSPSALLTMFLDEYVSLAIDINSEKARSEFIIAPILGDVRRQLNHQISLFSGKDFDVDSTQGLNGFCDFILSYSKEQFFIQAPVVTIAEAKNENIIGGLGQCVAEMVAAQLFNQNTGMTIDVIYGAVTTGTNWRFLKLQNSTVWIDTIEYSIRDVDKILGILLHPFRELLEKTTA